MLLKVKNSILIKYYQIQFIFLFLNILKIKNGFLRLTIKTS
ncbi:MAG: hypothetical protein H6Q19_837 [Bacteroidetes bacterium]|nr:hypothetical protein [Bacteroidota bacterium]